MGIHAGTETAWARVIAVFGAAKPHCGCLCTNRRANLMKVLVNQGIGASLAERRLNQGNLLDDVLNTDLEAIDAEL
ncbi:hypothetical protein [Pseudomonas huanghezhanensis]|uniref:hypothetical protein n=1 Tax=Pseudomonas huanghezhanensis TaxID=3002903 RepID=UPI0038B549F1